MSMSNTQLFQVLEKCRLNSSRIKPAEWEMRVNLAACYRLIAHFKMTDWIYNHISASVPGEPNHYLINPFGLLYEEVCASNLVKVDINGNLVDDVDLDVNPAAFVIHGAIHRARPDAVCALHTHTEAGVGVSAQADGLLPLSQHGMRFYGRVAYHDFEGVALDLDEQARLAEDLGDKNVLILRNHGLLTLGASVADAFKEMYYLERACRFQVNAQAGGTRLNLPPEDVCLRTADQFARDSEFLQQRDWRALLRLLDRADPSYKN